MKITLSPFYSKPSWVAKYGLLWYSIDQKLQSENFIQLIKEFTKTKTKTAILKMDLDWKYYDWDICQGQHVTKNNKCTKCGMHDSKEMRQKFPEIVW